MWGPPSGWSHRVPSLLLALFGAAIAVYLTAFQLHLVGAIWDPIFDGGSRQVLTSRISEMLPVPDALLGTLAYLAEAGLLLVGGTDRWCRTPWLVLANAAVAAGLSLTALVLIGLQAFVVGAWCTLCLTSAATSLLIGALTISEARAALSALGGSPAAR